MSARFARPYAEALIESVPPSFDFGRFLAPLGDVSAAISESGMLRAVLANPSVTADAKRGILASLGVRAGVDELGARFLRLLLDNGRILRISEVLDAVREALDAREGVVPASVKSAVPLDAAAQARVSDALARATGRKVRAAFSTEPSLLAGFVARVGSTVYDASALGAIERFKGDANGN